MDKSDNSMRNISGIKPEFSQSSNTPFYITDSSMSKSAMKHYNNNELTSQKK